MYYLFITKKKDIEKYMLEFNRVKENREKGKTPVFNELRSAKTCFFESFPFNLISGALMICGTLLLEKINANVLLNIALVMIINSFCYQIANYVFTLLKHGLRIKLCSRLGIEPSEDNIAVMESLEYQSV